MTPARLHALIDMDEWAHDQANDPQRAQAKRPAPSKDPFADLSALATM